MKFIPYLNFAGNAEEAMTYYSKVLSGEVAGIARFGESGDPTIPEARKNLVMHGEVRSGDLLLYFSDSPDAVVKGNGISILISCDSEEQIDKLYAAFAPGSTVHQPLQKTFWNAKYAYLVDRYGISWQLNYQMG